MTAIYAHTRKSPPSTGQVRELAVQASQLDVTAFGDLYRHYFPQILRFVSARVSGYQEAEDLTNTIFEKAYAAIGRYEPSPAQFSTWLYTIARNCVIDHYRKRRLPIQEDAEAEMLATVDPADDPETLLLEDDRRRGLWAALRQLTDEQRQVVGCRFFFNLSILEVATLMDKTEGAVKALQFRALEGLRRQLAPDLLAS
jgi:RNA polymerase sigma-70 factor (ECF subfamily)